MSQTQIDIVSELYAAFGRGGDPAILERLHEDVDWEMGAPDHGVPWLVAGRGRAHVARFFEGLQALEFSKFEVVSVMGDGRFVVGLVNVEATVRATGKKVVEPCEAHIWRLDDRGRVVAFRHRVDTHLHLLALRG
jgi:ketosteroid isomerase-like protein